jgi:hypothetical protein
MASKKYGRKKGKPSQQRYTSGERWKKNKTRKALKEANRTGHSVKIKINNEIITINPTK